jgi:uncharacterized tellurite resistance protein B-like protein
MDVNFVDADTHDFDPRTYLRILIAIAKADKDNGPPEFDYVRRQAERLGLDSGHFFKNTDKRFSIDHQAVSRLTALVILKDAIALASLDGNLSLPERMKIYTYAERLDISRNDVDVLEQLLDEYRQLDDRWRQMVKAH